jgi:hypothetical protein
MTRNTIESGIIIDYPFLWSWQAERGEDAGRKNRPVCVVLALPADGITHLVLLAISGTPPRDGQHTIEVPVLERRRAGLLEWRDAWITLSEYNYDIAERSVCLDPEAKVYGRFSRTFLAKVAEQFRYQLTSRKARIDRT